MRNKFYQYDKEHPYHISVGAVLYNQKGEVCVHHYFRDLVPEKLQCHLCGLDEMYILMRESLEDGETLQDAVARGLREEFGAEGVVEHYIGSRENFLDAGFFWKTTIYHTARLTNLGTRPPQDAEAFSKMEWIRPEVLIPIMKNQGALTGQKDIDESLFIERFLAMYGL